LSPKLPRDLDGQTLVRALERAGFVVERQSGAHAVLIHLALTAAREPVIHPRAQCGPRSRSGAARKRIRIRASCRQ
jgi:predicted RNA binding protein YcfA (HicA-like mRNA interferase family)